MRFKDLTGEKFGRLTVVKRIEDHYYPSGRHDVQYRCMCDCGNAVNVLGIHLRSGHTSSCGCYRQEVSREKMTTHGKTNSRLYTIWKNIKGRCFYEGHDDYAYYGGRGITICSEWKDNFECFYKWAMTHGYTDDLTIERVDVNLGYNPNNCKWIPRSEQSNNTRRNIIVTMNGETHTLKQWSSILGLKYGTIASRVKRGWTPEDALLNHKRIQIEHN